MFESKIASRIAFIGGGNMAEAIIGGLLQGHYPTGKIIVSEPLQSRQQYLKAKFSNLQVVSSNVAAISGEASELSGGHADVVIFAVKPQVLQQVAQLLSTEVIKWRPLVISIAAGIRTEDLEKWLLFGRPDAEPLSIIRAMPNTPALQKQGATALYATSKAKDNQRADAYKILDSVSQRIYWVENEEHLDIVTALSGSGPAYYFKFMAAMIRTATQLGLPNDISRGLAAQTCIGAGQMVLGTLDDCSELQRKVTSPNGTTEAAIKVLNSHNVSNALEAAILAAHRRSKELGETYSVASAQQGNL